MEIRKTCHSFPTQWDGYLDDGRYVYFRYRNGFLSIDAADSEEACNFGTGGTTVYSADLGLLRGSMDGHISDAEVRDFLKAVFNEEVNTDGGEWLNRELEELLTSS